MYITLLSLMSTVADIHIHMYCEKILANTKGTVLQYYHTWDCLHPYPW